MELRTRCLKRQGRPSAGGLEPSSEGRDGCSPAALAEFLDLLAGPLGVAEQRSRGCTIDALRSSEQSQYSFAADPLRGDAGIDRNQAPWQVAEGYRVQTSGRTGPVLCSIATWASRIMGDPGKVCDYVF